MAVSFGEVTWCGRVVCGVSVPTSLKEGRGSLCDMAGSFIGADVAAGGAFGGR